MTSDHRRLVAVRLPPGPAFAEGLRSVWQAGNAALPLSHAAPRPAVVETLKALHPDAILDEQGERPLPDGDGVPDGTALVVATSGTTGTPKGVVLSHRALRASADITLRRLGLPHGARWICCLPTHHIAGLNVIVRAWRCGADPVILPDFSVEAIADALPADAISLVPRMLARLLDAGIDLSGFRAVLIGGAPMPPGLAERARDAGAPITFSYGMTETCGGCVYDGEPLDDVTVRIEPDGRIAVRGPILFDGYRGSDLDAEPHEGGWFVTNDLGRLDDQGRLEVLGRADNVIITGGENIAPEEVERVLCEHPAIADAAVVGRPDPEWGEAVVAVVVPAGRPPSADEVRAFVKARAEEALAPRDLVVVDDLPRLESGKLDREAVRRAHGGE